MRIALVSLCTALGAAAAPAAAAPFHSDNVSLVTKLPEAVGAASARFSEDGKTMYVSTWKGLLLYDVSAPADPQRLGFLPLPHFENEDVDAGGNVVIITNDPSEGVGMIYVVDVSNPMLPTIKSTIRNGDIVGFSNSLADSAGIDQNKSDTGHIANCIQDCKYLWTTGTGEGLVVWDLTDLAKPKYVREIKVPGGGFTHDVFVDKSGTAWVTGGDGTFGYDTIDPTNPQLVYRSDDSVKNSGSSGPNIGQPVGDHAANEGPLDFLHHNAIRTDVTLDPGFVKPAAVPGVASRVTGGGLGDIVAVTEEDYARPGCDGQGSVQTWQITPGAANEDDSTKLKLLDIWTTELNELQTQTGRSPATVMCSAHWFDEAGGLLAQGWYDQGVRIMDIRHPNDIRQVGYWTTQGEFWGAYYPPTDPTHSIVYGLDITSGIDVLRIDRTQLDTVSIPFGDQLEIQRLRTARGLGVRPSPRFGYACALLR